MFPLVEEQKNLLPFFLSVLPLSNAFSRSAVCLIGEKAAKRNGNCLDNGLSPEHWSKEDKAVGLYSLKP